MKQYGMKYDATIIDTPQILQSMDYSMVWTKKKDHDQEQAWLRNLIRRVAKEQGYCDC